MAEAETEAEARVEERKIKLEYSKYEDKDRIGDFQWEIKEEIKTKPEDKTLWIFNDNEEERETSTKGEGNAIIRPYNKYSKYNPPHSAGVTTGKKNTLGYKDLHENSKKIIDEDLNIIKDLLATGNYKIVKYSGDKYGKLSNKIFTELSEKVKKYIVDGLNEIVNSYNELSAKEAAPSTRRTAPLSFNSKSLSKKATRRRNLLRWPNIKWARTRAAKQTTPTKQATPIGQTTQTTPTTQAAPARKVSIGLPSTSFANNINNAGNILPKFEPLPVLVGLLGLGVLLTLR